MATVDALIRQLKKGKPQARADAAEKLGELGDQRAVPVLVETLMFDANPRVRAEAAYALGELKNPETVDALIEALQKDRNPQVHRAAAAALGSIKDPKAVKPLSRALLKNKSKQVRIVAANALGVIGDPESAEPLIHALQKDKETEVRRAAAKALITVNDSRATHPLIKALQEEDAFLRQYAATALGALRASEATDALISILERDWDNSVRVAAAEALGKIGDPKAVPALLGRVHSSYEDIDVRIAATRSVAKIGDLNAVPELLNAYGVCTKKLEKPILLAIGQILGRTFPDDDNSREIYSDALNTLIHLVQNDASYLPLRVRYDARDRAEAAAEALGRTGAPKAIPVLTTALERYPDMSVRKAARESLHRFILTHPDAVLRISPEDRHRLGRLIQDAQRDELAQKLCK